ncbi:MAG TPA: DUF72 domain-containing protein [Dehalococcoidia bacterium]|nr:DUF72 domain-containing protein [Dehalococcoidia bacterium]
MVEYRIGTSGWHYQHWIEQFYPANLSKSAWLGFYAQNFSTVELNNSFYRLPSERAFVNWREAVPADFVYSVKVSRFITHIKRLREPAQPLETFLGRAYLLGKKLGPLLYQLPPQMKRDASRLEAFLKLLPKDTCHVFEFRHRSWMDDTIFDLLGRYGVGFCIYDMPEFTTPQVTTADFAYIRFHGSQELYGGCYSDEELWEWVRKIAGLKVTKVYIYFNNDIGGFAVSNAVTLMHLLEEKNEQP